MRLTPLWFLKDAKPYSALQRSSFILIITFVVAGVLASVFGLARSNSAAKVFRSLGTAASHLPAKTSDSYPVERLRATVDKKGPSTAAAAEAIAADADGDGIRTSLDAALIARRVAGLPGFGIVGTWKFVPVNRTYTSLGSNQINQNFTAILVGDTSGNWIPAIPSGGGDDSAVSGSAPQRSNATLSVTAGRSAAATLPNQGDFSFGLKHSFIEDPSRWKASRRLSSGSWLLPLTLPVISNSFTEFMMNRRWY